MPRFLYGTAWKKRRRNACSRTCSGTGISGYRYRQPSAAITTRLAVGAGDCGSGRERPAAPCGDGLFLHQRSSPSVMGGDHRLLYDPEALDPAPGGAVLRQLARAPGCCSDRFRPAARPHSAGRPGAGGLGGLGARWEAIHDSVAGHPASASVTSPSTNSRTCAGGTASDLGSSKTDATPLKRWDQPIRDFSRRQCVGLPGLLSADRKPWERWPIPKWPGSPTPAAVTVSAMRAPALASVR